MQTQTYPRHRYLIAIVAFIDFPLWVEVRHRVWMVATILVLLMVVVIGRRFVEIGWRRAWSVPYSLVAISPLAILYLVPSFNPWPSLICVAALQLPAMLWPPLNHQSRGPIAIDD